MSYQNKSQQQTDKFDISWIQKEVRCWVYLPHQNDSEIFLKGIVKGIVPQSLNKGNSKVTGILENGTTFQTRAHFLQKCRQSNSIEKDLIEMDIINAPEVLSQLRRRLDQRKIHTCLWNSLIIVNPFKLIPEQYSQKTLLQYYENIYIKKEDLRKYEPHTFSFTFKILADIQLSQKAQVISISGESGSGKTQTNKQCLKAISFCCSKVQKNQSNTNMESKILECDPILQAFGNSKTIKNDNSSRFGKLITMRINGQKMKIYHSSIKNFFLEKSRVISQSNGERNFHIFYQFLSFLPEEQKAVYKLKSRTGATFRIDDFNYLSQKSSYDKQLYSSDKEMWQNLNSALIKLQFSKENIHELWSIISAILLLGNVSFDGSHQTQTEPCEIRNIQIAQSISQLFGVNKKQMLEGLVLNKKTIAGQHLNIPLTAKQCNEGRDSISKSIYEALFQWIVEEMNRKLNSSNFNEQNLRFVKLLDIYGFEVFDSNSFQQLCVNYTNQKIHQIYLEQVFIHQKNTLKKEGLESIIQKLTFTDNVKIIELLDTLNKSVFNLLDESCSLNVKDDDFLSNVRKIHENHEHFPANNSVNVRKTFIIKHTPGDIQYTADGFRDKNKDLVREDIVQKISLSKINILSEIFKNKLELMKNQTNKKFLGVKIRRQVKDLITEMSTNSDLHFIRCIKPNEKKEPFKFIQRVCHNQIKYLGILDTIQMRRDSYHIRTPYQKFYEKYGILQQKLKILILMSEGKLSGGECKDIVMQFMNSKFINFNLQYLFGKERIFLKMSSQNVIEIMLQKKIKSINYAATIIKASYKAYKMNKVKNYLKYHTVMIQHAIKRYMKIVSVVKRKKAVLIIEKAWIKYQAMFFLRKRRKPLMILQKYIKKQINIVKQQSKIKATRKCKVLLKSMALTHKIKNNFQLFQSFKADFLIQIYQNIWNKMSKIYANNISKYLKNYTVCQTNTYAIKQAQKGAEYRLNIKHRKNMQKYLKGFIRHMKYQQKKNSILYIQSWFRMLKVRRYYLNLKNNAIKIQRNWRKYYFDKQYNFEFTENYFQNKKQSQNNSLQKTKLIWNDLLYREYNKSSKLKERGIERLLYNQEKIKLDKISLFYYLLDFEILCDLSDIYPAEQWIKNYTTLFESSWEKGNPIQYVDISNQHTICSTINKVYTWGQLNYKSQELTLNKRTLNESKQGNQTIQSIAINAGLRINKIVANNKFTLIEMMDGEEQVILGDKSVYEEDSNKEWRTINESFIVINGIILTLDKISMTKISIPDKVVQLSCGMKHCIIKTSLKKVYTWGDNSYGQLGHANFIRLNKPKMVDFVAKNILTIHQVSASAYGSLMLDSNSKIWWWGSNGTIKYQPFPKQCLLFEKSEVLDNQQKYSIVRVISKWSKSLSLIGVTVACHEGIFKNSQSNIRKKTYENLISKWNEDINTINPPHIQSISGYFQERHMPKQKNTGKNPKQYDHQRIRQKLLNQIDLMEKAQRNLLRDKYSK